MRKENKNNFVLKKLCKRALLLALFAFFVQSCQLSSNRSHESMPSGLVDPKYSIAKDRSELERLRESLPVEVKKENDEKALMAELMSELRYPPEGVREKYMSQVRKKRDLFNKDMSKAREEYGKNEKKARDEFLKKMEEERRDFLSGKVDRERRARFFNEQDEERRTYFAESREKREEFEAEFREKRKNFEDYAKEKTDEFNAELKNYTVRWKEKLQREKEAAEAAEQQSP